MEKWFIIPIVAETIGVKFATRSIIK